MESGKGDCATFETVKPTLDTHTVNRPQWNSDSPIIYEGQAPLALD